MVYTVPKSPLAASILAARERLPRCESPCLILAYQYDSQLMVRQSESQAEQPTTLRPAHHARTPVQRISACVCLETSFEPRRRPRHQQLAS